MRQNRTSAISRRTGSSTDGWSSRSAIQDLRAKIAAYGRHEGLELFRIGRRAYVAAGVIVQFPAHEEGIALLPVAGLVGRGLARNLHIFRHGHNLGALRQMNRVRLPGVSPEALEVLGAVGW